MRLVSAESTQTWSSNVRASWLKSIWLTAKDVNEGHRMQARKELRGVDEPYTLNDDEGPYFRSDRTRLRSRFILRNSPVPVDELRIATRTTRASARRSIRTLSMRLPSTG